MNLRLAGQLLLAGVTAFGVSTAAAQAAFSNGADEPEVTADGIGGSRSNIEVLQSSTAGDITVDLTLSTDPSGAQCLSAELRDAQGPVGMLGGCDQQSDYQEVISGASSQPISFDGLIRLRGGGLAQVIGGLSPCASCTVTALLSDGGRLQMTAAGHGFVSIDPLVVAASSFDLRDIDSRGASDRGQLPTITQVIID